MAPIVNGRYSKIESTESALHSLPPEDLATVSQIKGKGFALTFSSHFAVAVIVGVSAALAGHHSAPLPEAQQAAVQHLTEEVAALRADLVQLRAEVAQEDKNTEWKLNELLTRK